MIDPLKIESQVNDLLEKSKSSQPEEAQEILASGLAKIITEAILSSSVTVIIPTGMVTVGSSPAAIPTPVPITLKGTLK